MKKVIRTTIRTADVEASILEETREEILDTIRVCEDFLDDSVQNDDPRLAHVFSFEAIEFAKIQIAFEKARLAKMGATS